MATNHIQLPWGKKILNLNEDKKLKLDVDFKKRISENKLASILF